MSLYKNYMYGNGAQVRDILAIFIQEHKVTIVASAIYEEWSRSVNLITRGLIWMYLGMCLSGVKPAGTHNLELVLARNM